MEREIVEQDARMGVCRRNGYRPHFRRAVAPVFRIAVHGRGHRALRRRC